MMRTAHVDEWLRYADEDLTTAEIMLGEGSLPNPICFHAQQAGEKSLKGYLAANGKHVQKIHALDSLLVQCMGIDSAFRRLEDDATYVQQFYTEARYPGDIPSFTMAQARKAYDAAKRIQAFVEERLDAGTKNVAA